MLVETMFVETQGWIWYTPPGKTQESKIRTQKESKIKFNIKKIRNKHEGANKGFREEWHLRVLTDGEIQE